MLFLRWCCLPPLCFPVHHYGGNVNNLNLSPVQTVTAPARETPPVAAHRLTFETTSGTNWLSISDAARFPSTVSACGWSRLIARRIRSVSLANIDTLCSSFKGQPPWRARHSIQALASNIVRGESFVLSPKSFGLKVLLKPVVPIPMGPSP